MTGIMIQLSVKLLQKHIVKTYFLQAQMTNVVKKLLYKSTTFGSTLITDQFQLLTIVVVVNIIWHRTYCRSVNNSPETKNNHIRLQFKNVSIQR